MSTGANDHPSSFQPGRPLGSEDHLRAVRRDDGSTPRVFVLGATGYLGGRLVSKLLAGRYRAFAP